MTDTNTLLILIIGLGLTNLALRFLPLLALSKVNLPRPIMRWLSFVPVSVMGALFAKEVLLPSAEFDMPLQNPGIYGALVAMLAYKLTKSFVGSTLAGVISFILIRELFTRLF